MAEAGVPIQLNRFVGDKRYELTNHLGNVLSVITDRKLIGGTHAETGFYSENFATGHTGWASTVGAAIADDNGRLKVTVTDNFRGAAYSSLSLVAGHTYTFSVDIDKTGYPPDMRLRLHYVVPGPPASSITVKTVTITGQVSRRIEFTYTPTVTATYVLFAYRSDVDLTAPESFYIDNVVVNEITDSFALGYVPDVVAFNDYYPFGMLVPERNAQDMSEHYRFGFQGQERDDELKGPGNSLNYTFRMHDPRIGRFFAVDPLTKKYPHYTPYSFSGNKTIAHVELEGLEDIWTMEKRVWDGSVVIQTIYRGDENYESNRGYFADLMGVKMEDLPDNGALYTSVQLIPHDSGVTSTLIKNSYLSPIVIDSDQRTWMEMGDDFVNRHKGNSAHEGEDWVNSFQAGAKFSYRTKTGKIEYELGIFSTHENSVGLYSKTTITNGLIIGNNWKVKNFDLPSPPSLSLFAKTNSKNSFNDPFIKSDVKIKASASFETETPINLTYDTETSINSGKTNHSFGIEGGINVKPKVEASAAETTTILNTSKQINLNGG